MAFNKLIFWEKRFSIVCFQRLIPFGALNQLWSKCHFWSKILGFPLTSFYLLITSRCVHFRILDSCKRTESNKPQTQAIVPVNNSWASPIINGHVLPLLPVNLERSALYLIINNCTYIFDLVCLLPKEQLFALLLQLLLLLLWRGRKRCVLLWMGVF